MNTLSVIIITHNEERNIGRCLDAVKEIADEIIVVDSGSTDRTQEICLQYKVKWVHHDWEGFSQQKNYADSLASCDWIMSIDADEVPDEQMSAHIMRLKHGAFQHGHAYRMRRLTNFCGHWVHHCGWYPDAKVRIWERGTASWVGDVHEKLSYSKFPQIDSLEGDLLHYSYYSVAEYDVRQVQYYTLAAHEYYAKGRSCTMLRIVLEPLWKFISIYFFKLGFLDGSAGFYISKLSAHYTMMKYALLRELSQK